MRERLNMEKRQLLFVTHLVENMTEGVSYAIELAKAMDEDIMILFVQKRKSLGAKFEDLMSAVAFAEAGEHRTAETIGAETRQYPGGAPNHELVNVLDKCLHEGVRVTVHTSPQDVLSGVRTFLKERRDINKVLLSPAVIDAGNFSSKEMNRLVRAISRPVVTMARQPLAIAGGAEQA